MQVALVEDDPIIARAVSAAVTEAGHRCEVLAEWVTEIDAQAFLGNDLVILDLMLPGLDGLDILRRLRTHGVRTPVIVLTARGAVSDKLKAFEAGADDYMVKPFSMDELMARLEAVHRRTADRPSLLLEAGDMRLSLANKRLTVAGRTVDLTPTELSIMELLMRYNGQVVTRKMLCEHVWGFDWEGPTNVIEVHMNRLRGKVDQGRDASCIRTIRGRGYALTVD